MGGSPSTPSPPPPTPPPVSSTGADSGRRAIDNRNRQRKRYGFQDTLLSGSSNNGFSASDLDPQG